MEGKLIPSYSYQCSCGLQFDAFAPASKHSEPKRCPACNNMAPRMMPSDMNGIFSQTVNGPGPQNTGIHSLDLHIDRVIGQHAKQGWEQEELRRREKRRVLAQNPNARSADLSLNPDGSYRVRKPEEKAVHERGIQIHLKAQEALGQAVKPHKKPSR